MKQSRIFKSFPWLLIFCLSFSLFVATPARAQGLSASPSYIEIGLGKKIMVTFSGAPGNQLDAVGLYRVGDTKCINYLFLNTRISGTIEFPAPQEPGSYEFQMWENDWEKKIATSNQISIDWGKVKLSHNIGNHFIGPDKKILVSFSNAPGYGYDSIGLFRVGQTESIALQYLHAKTSGTLEFKDPETPGFYEFRMWANRDKKLLAISSQFTLKWHPVNMKVSIGSPDVKGERKLSIQYSGAPGFWYDAIGLFKEGQTESVTRMTLSSKTSGTIVLRCPTDTDSYKLQLYTQDTTGFKLMIAKTQAFIPKNGPPPSVNQDPNNPLPPAPADSKITILLTIGSKNAYVNQQLVVLDVPPFIDSGRTFVPFRFIGESLGAVVGFSKNSSGRVDTVTYSLGTTNIILYIGKREATVNGQTVYLDVAPKILQGRTVIPMRFVTEALGCKVDWDGQKMQVTIVYPA